MNKSKRRLWQQPWGYAESFVIAFGILLVGFVLEISSNTASVPEIKFPINLIVGASYLIVFLAIYFLIRKTTIYRFLSGVPASIGAISVLTLLVILMGVTPQTEMDNQALITRFGLNHLTASWPFLLVNLYLLFVLGLTIVRKSFPFQWKNWGFICSHLGLWIVIFAAGLGAGDLMRLRMDLHENKVEWKAYDDQHHYYELPLAIKLKDFVIDEFHPKLAVIRNKTGKLVEKRKPSLIMIEKGLNCQIQEWKVRVEEYYPTSGRAGDRYYSIMDYGAAPAAKVQAVKANTRDTIRGWISCGSFNRQHESLKLDEEYSLVMTVPEPKRFSSKVSIYTPDGKTSEQVLEVNKSYTVNGWKIYQLSYDEKMGKYSSLSIVEAVKDPWQTYVYIGVFMMMIGAFYMFWRGNKLSVEKEMESQS